MVRCVFVRRGGGTLVPPHLQPRGGDRAQAATPTAHRGHDNSSYTAGASRRTANSRDDGQPAACYTHGNMDGVPPRSRRAREDEVLHAIYKTLGQCDDGQPATYSTQGGLDGVPPRLRRARGDNVLHALHTSSGTACASRRTANSCDDGQPAARYTHDVMDGVPPRWRRARGDEVLHALYTSSCMTRAQDARPAAVTTASPPRAIHMAP